MMGPSLGEKARVKLQYTHMSNTGGTMLILGRSWMRAVIRANAGSSFQTKRIEYANWVGKEFMVNNRRITPICRDNTNHGNPLSVTNSIRLVDRTPWGNLREDPNYDSTDSEREGKALSKPGDAPLKPKWLKTLQRATCQCRTLTGLRRMVRAANRRNRESTSEATWQCIDLGRSIYLAIREGIVPLQVGNRIVRAHFTLDYAGESIISPREAKKWHGRSPKYISLADGHRICESCTHPEHTKHHPFMRTGILHLEASTHFWTTLKEDPTYFQNKPFDVQIGSQWVGELCAKTVSWYENDTPRAPLSGRNSPEPDHNETPSDEDSEGRTGRDPMNRIRQPAISMQGTAMLASDADSDEEIINEPPEIVESVEDDESEAIQREQALREQRFHYREEQRAPRAATQEETEQLLMEYRRLGVEPSLRALDPNEPAIPSLGRKISQAL